MKRPHFLLGVAILTLRVVSCVCGASFALEVETPLRSPLQSGKNLSLVAVEQSTTSEPSASELNRQLTNPVSSIWSISNQFNNFELNNGQWNNN